MTKEVYGQNSLPRRFPAGLQKVLKSVRSRKASATVQEAILDDLVRAENHRMGQNFDRLHPKARVRVASRPEKAEADSPENFWKGLGYPTLEVSSVRPMSDF